MKCKTCGQELPDKSKTIEVGNVLYDIQTTQKNVSYNDLKIPKGKRLWTAEECIKLHNDKKLRKKLNLEDCWFWIQQPFELNKQKGYVARFGADSDGPDLDCDRNPGYSYSALGVRFAQDLKKKKTI